MDDEARVSYTAHSITSETILKRILRENNSFPDSYVFFPSCDKEELPDDRLTEIWKRLDECYSRLSKVYEKHYDKEPPTLNSIFALGPFIAWQKGVTPFMNEVLSSEVLTVSHPLNADLPLLHGSAHMPVKALRTYPQILKCKDIDDNYCTPVMTDEERDIFFKQWKETANTILNKLIEGLKSINNGRFENQRADTLEFLDTAKREADAIAPSDSALHLAIDWTRNNILVSESWGASSTVKTYISNVFRNGFFDYHDCISLNSWEPEDYGFLLEKRLNQRKPKKNKKARKKLKRTTKEQIIEAFKFLGRFIVENKYSDAVDISNIVPEWSGGTTRTDIIGLYEFDGFVKLLAQDGSRTSLMYAVACILGYYGGLRSHSEVCALTLADVTIINGQVFVEIPRGKTKASRRRIPLSLLAPQELSDIVIDYIKIRKSEFDKLSHLRKTSLFGPEGKA